MLSVSVSDQVRFKNKRGHVISTLPVTIEFDKFIRSSCDKGAKITNSGDRKKQGGKDADQIATPGEFLHAVAAFYDTCLPDHSLQSIYKTVCTEGARTLLLLRDCSEILQEWEHHIPNQFSQQQSTTENTNVSVTEINNNPPEDEGESGNGNGSEMPTPSETLSETPKMPPSGDNAESLEGSATSADLKRMDFQDESEANSSVDGNQVHEDWLPWKNKIRNTEDDNRLFRENFCRTGLLTTPSVIGSPKVDRDGHSISPFSDVFTDSEYESDSESEMEEEDDSEDLSRGMANFLRAVALRKHQKRSAIEKYNLQPSHVGIEHRLVACATFHKSYKIPGTRLICLDFIAVRRKYRKCGIGRHVLKRLKSPSQVGPFDALVVRVDTSSLPFFKKNGFTDDIIINSRFREVDEAWEHCTLMCYLPPFDGQYPPLPGAQEWNRPESVAAIQEEIEKWKARSLDSYQWQLTCMTRLQQEILRLHNVIRRQEATIKFLKQENERLHGRLTKAEKSSTMALIEALEQEAEDFERLCNLQLRRTEIE